MKSSTIHNSTPIPFRGATIGNMRILILSRSRDVKLISKTVSQDFCALDKSVAGISNQLIAFFIKIDLCPDKSLLGKVMVLLLID